MKDTKLSPVKAQARLQFADWLQETHPKIFAAAIRKANIEADNGLGAADKPTQSFWQRFSTAAMGLGTTLLSLKNQKAAMKINLERAKAGLPPIDASTSAPVVRTQLDLSPQLTRSLVSTAGEGINKTLLMAGVAAIAAIFFLRK